MDRYVPENGGHTLHQVVMLALESRREIGKIRPLLDLIDHAGLLFHCLAYFLVRCSKLWMAGVPMGGLANYADGKGCCDRDYLFTTTNHAFLGSTTQGTRGADVHVHRRLDIKEAENAIESKAVMDTVAAVGAVGAAGALGPGTISKWLWWASPAVAKKLGLSVSDLPCDPRLKRRVRCVDDGRRSGGVPWYTFEWNAEAGRRYGLTGRAQGPMSTDLRRVLPDVVSVDPRTGYDRIDYAAVVRHTEDAGGRNPSHRRRRSVTPERARKRLKGP